MANYNYAEYKLMYISISLELVSPDYLSKVTKPTNNKLHQSLVYGADDDIYFLSVAVGRSTEREIVCNSQEEFHQKVSECKLLRLL